ncbi:MAG: ribonuclease Y [bacterium]
MILFIGIGFCVSSILYFIFYFISIKQGKSKIYQIKKEAKDLLQEAQKEADIKRKESNLLIKDELHRLRIDFEKEAKTRKEELHFSEKRLGQKEENLEKKLSLLEKRETVILNKEKEINNKQKTLTDTEKEIEFIKTQQKKVLEEISKMSSEEAKKLLLSGLIEEARYESAKKIKEIEVETKQTIEKKAKDVLSLAIAKCAPVYVAEATVCVVPLNSDEIKGRIIGREGRNIRTFEMATGVDLIIDDTPEAVVISGFDPMRREIARIALEKLIVDGRIHPTRIEEIVKKVTEEMEKSIIEEGEKAAFDAGVYGLHPELIKLLGRLKYRTSYGQNILQHSLEVTYLAEVLAGELNVDIKLAKRAALIHDIGKAVDRDVEGTHITIGAQLAKKYGESAKVINIIMAHHEDEEPETIEAVLVQAADSLSASRPGARKETLEKYIKRIEKLEKIVNLFKGVEKTYALQAGREVRVIIDPAKISDEEIYILTKDIAKKIQEELEYPGQIKVTVIREIRVVDYAK